MLGFIKRFVIAKTIQYAETRYGIFVWIRQTNERLLKLEEKETEQAVQQRAESETYLDSKLQKLEARLENLENVIECLPMPPNEPES